MLACLCDIKHIVICKNSLLYEYLVSTAMLRVAEIHVHFISRIQLDVNWKASL